MKKTGMVVAILLFMGWVLVPCSGAHAATDGFYNLMEVPVAWDGTDANRTKAPTADYDYIYGDEASLAFTLPWPFTIYGHAYNRINVDTNGNVWFTAAGFANSFNLATTGRGPVIAAWNDDLTSYYQGGTFVQHKNNPERVVIEWRTETYTEEAFHRPNAFEVVLFPDGTVRFDYQSFSTAFGDDFGSGISRGDGNGSLSLTAIHGKVFTLGGRSFAVVPAPQVQIVSPAGFSASREPLLNFTISNGTVVAVKVDGAPVATVAGQNLNALADGPHTVTVEAVNNGGPGSAIVTFIVDSAPPGIMVAGVADGGFYPRDVTPVVTIVDPNLAGSGVTLNGGTYAAGTPVTAEGSYSLVATATDLAGNGASLATGFIIDKTPPVSTASVGLPQYAANGRLTVSGQAPITVSASDGGTTLSGVARIEYQVDGQSWREYAAPITLAGLPDGSHAIVYRAFDRAGNREEPPHTLVVTLDGTAPEVAALPAGAIYATAQNVTLTANEGGAIHYTLDGTPPTAASPIYGQPLPITATTTLSYFAMDLIGNRSVVKTESYVIDMIAPVLVLSTLGDGTYTNNDTLNLAGTVRDDTGIRELQVNGVAVPLNDDGSFSHALILAAGPNTITTTATDLAGNRSVDTRTIILDQTAPVLVVTLPPDNSKTGSPLLEVRGTVDKNAVVTLKVKEAFQAAIMDGTDFTATVALNPGYNTIEITAIDVAGNSSTQKRTVIYDDQKPSLAVTDPGQDLRINRDSLTIRGTASDLLTGITVAIRKDAETYVPPVVNGAFEQTLTFATEKPYEIIVTATNEVGTATAVQRNVFYDITPPLLTIAPVVTPTNQAIQIVSGTRDAEASVTASCSTAVVGAVSYPTAGTWQATVTDLKVGENPISVSSADTAGNRTTVSATIVHVTQPPEVRVTATPNVLWPPDGRMVSVTIGGDVVTNGYDMDAISIGVTDEYGRYNYKDLRFGSTILLEARRNGNDKDGRVYTVTVVASDKSGNRVVKTTTVLVPHDTSK